MKKEEIKQAFENSMKLKVQSISLLGKGVSNVNYLIKASNRKFVFRINANSRRLEKSKKEFDSLKAIERLGISPKPFYLRKNFIIVSYIEGAIFKGKVTSGFLRSLAKLVAEIHSLKPNYALPKEGSYVTNSEVNTWLKYLNNHIEDKSLLKIILEAKRKLEEEQNSLKKFGKIPLVLAHGDICEQNVLETPKGLALIDFEDFSLKDPADDIAKVFVDFKEPLSDTQKEIFLKEYSKTRADTTLEERIKIYEKMIIFLVFVWSIDYILRIKNKEMHGAFLTGRELKKGMDYTKIMFKRTINFGIIDKKYSKLDIESILT